MLLPHTDAAGAVVAAERFRCAIASACLPASVSGLDFTASVGVAVLHGGDIDEMVREADRALYAAKANGRNRVEVSPARLSPAVRSGRPALDVEPSLATSRGA